VQPRDNPHGVRDIFSRHAYDQQLGQYAEAAQGIIRIFVAPVVALYIAAIVSGAIAVELTVPEDHQSLSKLRSNLHLLLYLTMVQAAIAAGILTWILKSPKANPIRRVIAVGNDYITIAAVLALGGRPMAPIFVLLLWLTIGSGLRYGLRYLVWGAVASLLAMCVAIATNSFWQSQPFTSATLILVAILVPAYVYLMLRTMQRAHASEHVANQAKSQFLAVMSHELRAPLTGIIAMTQLLLGRRQPAAEHEVTHAIKGSAESLLLVVDDLLDVSTSDTNRIRLAHEDFQIHAVVARLEKMVLATAREKSLALTTSIADNVPSTLRGDQHRLTQVLLNLLHNAIKFTETGSVSLVVTLASRDQRVARLRMEVRDTGKGVPHGLKARLFEPFAQEDGSLARRHGGIGLGTTIARNLVEQFGGVITVEDNPGGGSIFVVTAPFEFATMQPDPASEIVASPGPFIRDESQEQDIYSLHRETTRPLRVLSVEDQRPNRIMLQSILNKAGHRPVMCADPERAVNYLIEEQFDLVILDVHMPGLSGIDIVRRLRALESDDVSTPVLFLTADMTQQTVTDALAAGGTQVLTKPIRADHLLNAIAQVAGKAERQREGDAV
jgi:two-component system sensor histidine kinase RpfC